MGEIYDDYSSFSLRPDESPEVRANICSVLTQFDRPDVCEALARSFETDTANRRYLGTLVWRLRGVVDRLVARMIATWKTDPAFARDVLSMLKEEYISVPRAQLTSAPEELVTALGSLAK